MASFLTIEGRTKKVEGRIYGPFLQPSIVDSRFSIVKSPLSLLITLLFIGCADPRPPTGGPRDQIPPTLETTTPEAGTVNVTASSVRLDFSEYVDQASFTRAFSINPAPEKWTAPQ